MSFSETLFLFFLALIIFGPKKLPEIARQIGKVMNEFRRASNEFKSQIEQEIAHIEVEERRKTMLPASPAPAGTTSRTLTAGSELGPAEPATAGSASESSNADADPAAKASVPAAPSSVVLDGAATPMQESSLESRQESQQESHA